jgi:hypothetical protein
MDERWRGAWAGMASLGLAWAFFVAGCDDTPHPEAPMRSDGAAFDEYVARPRVGHQEYCIAR